MQALFFVAQKCNLTCSPEPGTLWDFFVWALCAHHRARAALWENRAQGAVFPLGLWLSCQGGKAGHGVHAHYDSVLVLGMWGLGCFPRLTTAWFL